MTNTNNLTVVIADLRSGANGAPVTINPSRGKTVAQLVSLAGLPEIRDGQKVTLADVETSPTSVVNVSGFMAISGEAKGAQ